MSFASAIAAPEHAPESVIAGMLAALRVMAERFVASFGGPAALVKNGALYGKTRERILRWLHDMESVVRRLLLLRAALFPAPEFNPPGEINLTRSSARRRKEGDSVALFGPSDDPAQWRVAFRIIAPPEPAAMFAGAPFRAPASSYVNGHRVEAAPESGALYRGPLAYNIDDPRPLAERFEALLRVIQDPDHYAARLAQRLHLWRGRAARREIFLTSLCATTQIANEAGLLDEDWAHFAAARALAQTRLPVFSGTGALCDSG